MSIKSNNGTGNKTIGKRTHALGSGCVAVGNDQMVVGRYPEIPTGDASTDSFVVGGGRSADSRVTALRVTKDGEALIGGGYPVYMINPLTLELCKVFINGTNRRIKEVLMK